MQFNSFQLSRKIPLDPEFIEGQNVYFTVPQTDTGGLVEKTKAIGRKMIKELGNKSGRNLWEMPYQVPYGTWLQQKIT